MLGKLINESTRFLFNVVLIGLISGNYSCNGESENTPPEIIVNSASVTEGDQGSKLAQVSISTTASIVEPVEITYSTIDGSAKSDTDYTPVLNGILIIPSGGTGATVDIEILGDEVMEFKETFGIKFTNSASYILNTYEVTITIADNDDQKYEIQKDNEGYITPDNYPGMKLVWSDEFDEPDINTINWTFELGDGCPNVCGWGNNELESYTDLEENARINDGKLIITALKGPGENSYTSARMITKDKQEFEFGRIDVRAKLPEGKGIWPAIWMLGANIDDVGWPSCGEIDIMELVGDKPKTSHGTAHYSINGGHASQGNSYVISDNYSTEFHVFSIFWEQDIVRWYVDYNKFYELRASGIGYTYPFNSPFFFILNVAVGGNWPGDPDGSTIFPQEMQVDYVRVFQPE